MDDGPENAVTNSEVDCPPSSDQVLEVLQEHGEPMDPTEIQQRTGLARRTVYIALKCLQRMKAIVKGFSLQDTRRRKYAVARAPEKESK